MEKINVSGACYVPCGPITVYFDRGNGNETRRFFGTISADFSKWARLAGFSGTLDSAPNDVLARFAQWAIDNGVFRV